VTDSKRMSSDLVPLSMAFIVGMTLLVLVVSLVHQAGDDASKTGRGPVEKSIALHSFYGVS